MKVIIDVDGYDRPIRAETVEMSSRQLTDGRRSYRAALLIAVITAVVALGGLGPQVVAPPETVVAAACEPSRGAPDTIMAAEAAPWWQRASPRVWVDPQTGNLRQARQAGRVTPRQLVDHRARVH